MKLIDFTEDESLNALRKTMGADQLGVFELFDPERHLSWQDRQTLAKQWVSVSVRGLHSGFEQSLYFKNSPVVAKVEQALHFALCDELKKHISHGKLSEVSVTTSIEQIDNSSPCSFCLHAVGYEGFDVYRHRHQEYNNKIMRSFRLQDYIVKKHREFT